MLQTADRESAPLITVITLSYNSEYLLDSIRSVLDQTYEDIQYIIVDDGSRTFDKQEVIEYLDQHKRSNIREYAVLTNRQNQGTVKAFNRALRHAKGEYLFNLAADDLFYDSHVLEEWVHEFQIRNALFMMGQMVVYSSDMSRQVDVRPSQKEAEIIQEGNSEKLFEAMSGRNFIIGCSSARTKQIRDKYGYCDEAYVLLDDYPYVMKLLRENVRIDYWNRSVIKYRKGGISSPQNFNSVYEQDLDLNFQTEIFPYTKHKVRAYLQYHWWKWDHCESGKFSSHYSYIRRTRKWYLIPILCLRFPFPVARGLWRRAKKLFVLRSES